MRNKATISITDEGRDQGKVFVITEMPASRAERWAMRAFFLLSKAGVEIPDEIASAGMAGVAKMGLKELFKNISFEEAEPLLDELMGCVKIVRDKNHPDITFDLIEDDIEDIMTRLQLRAEAFKLHVGFLKAAFGSRTLI